MISVFRFGKWLNAVRAGANLPLGNKPPFTTSSWPMYPNHISPRSRNWNKCIASSNKCLTSSNKKLVVIKIN